MSKAWTAETLAAAAPAPIWSRPERPRFAATPSGAPKAFSPWGAPPAPMPSDPAPGPAAAPSIDLDRLRAEAFAEGFDAGARTERELAAPERAGLARLAAALDAFRPEPAADLGALLAESVGRLVRQVCGEVTFDAARLAERVDAVAAMVGEEAMPARLRLHPADAARLADAGTALPIVADASLPEGTILAETAAGWIEDGPAIRMERLRALLDQLGCARA